MSMTPQVAIESGTPLVTVAQCQTRLRISGHDSELADLIGYAQALVEGPEGIGGAIWSTTEVENVVVGDRTKVIKLRNIPVGTVTSITDPYGASYTPGAFVINAGAGLLEGYFFSPGQNFAASMFGAQNEALLSGLSGSQSDISPLLRGTWQVTYTGGKELDPRWERLIRPDLTFAVLLTVEDAYNVRTSRATTETDGANSHVLDISAGLPPRAAAICRKYSMLGL